MPQHQILAPQWDAAAVTPVAWYSKATNDQKRSTTVPTYAALGCVERIHIDGLISVCPHFLLFPFWVSSHSRLANSMALRAKVGCLTYLWLLIVGLTAVSLPADAANLQAQNSDSTSQATTPVSDETDQALPPLVKGLPVNKERIKKFLAVLTALEAKAPADSAAASGTRTETSATESRPFTEMISDEKVRESVDVLAKEQTFEDAQEWAQFGDRLSLLIGLVEMIRNEDFKQNEIDAVSKSQIEIRAAFDEDVK